MTVEMKKFGQEGMMIGDAEKNDTKKIVLNSLADLKNELHIAYLETPELEGLFNKPLEFTKEELDKLKSDLLGTDVNKMKILKDLINEKVQLTADTSKKVEGVKADIANASLTGITASAVTGLKSQIADIQNTEGTEKISKIGEFFEWAGSMWTKFTSFVALKFPKIAKFFGWEVDTGAVGDTTKGAKMQASTLGETSKDDKKAPNTEPGAKTEAIEINKDTFNEYLKQKTDAMIKKLVRMGLIKEDNALIRKKIKNIFEKNSGDLKEDFARYSKAIKGDGTANPLDTVGISGMAALKINIDLVSEGIIPLSALLIDASAGAIKLAYNTGKTALGWSVDDMNESIGMLSFEETGEVFKKLNPKQQAILIRLFNERAIFSFALLGILGKYLTESMILLPAWDQGVGIYGIVGEVSHLTGNFDTAMLQLEKVYKLMGIEIGGTGVAENMRNIFSSVMTKYAIKNAYLGADGKTGTFIKELSKLKTSGNKYINIQLINETEGLIDDVSAPLSKYSSPIVAHIKKPIIENLGFFKKATQSISRTIKGPYNNPSIYINEANQTAEKIVQGFGAEIENGKSMLTRFMARCGNFGKFEKLFHQTNKASFVINAGQEGKFADGVLKLHKEFAPGVVANFFNHLTVVVMIGSAIATRKEEGTSAVISQIKENMKMAIPIYGGYCMMHDGMELGKDSTFSQVGYVVTGVGMMAFDSYLASKIFRSGLPIAERAFELAKFGARPLTMTVETFAMASRGFFTARNSITNLIKAIKNGEKITINKGGKWTIAIAALAALTVVGIEYLEKNKEKGDKAFAEALKVDGIADKDGQVNIQKLVARFKNLPGKQRQYAVDMLASLHLGDNADGEKYSISNSDKGGFIVNIKDAIDPKRIEQFKEVIKTSGLENIFVFSGGVKKKVDDTILRTGLPDSVSRTLMESYKSI